MSTPAANVPAVPVTQTLMTPVVKINDRKTLPYVVFASKMGENYADMAAVIPGLKPPQPVLVINGSYKALNPLKFFLLGGQQFWVERKEGKDILSASADDPGYKSDKREEIHAAILVFTADGLVPATVTFKSGGCRGVAKSLKTLAQMSNTDPKRGPTISEWIALSADHKAAATIQLPPLRFTTVITAELKTAKNSGRDYVLTSGTVAPVTAAEAKAAQDFLANPEKAKEFQAVMDNLTNRVAEVVKFIK